MQVRRLQAQCAKTSTERDSLAAELKQLAESRQEDAQATAGTTVWAGGQLWNESLRLTERLAAVTSMNSEILSENAALTKQVEVRPLALMLALPHLQDIYSPIPFPE